MLPKKFTDNIPEQKAQKRRFHFSTTVNFAVPSKEDNQSFEDFQKYLQEAVLELVDRLLLLVYSNNARFSEPILHPDDPTMEIVFVEFLLPEVIPSNKVQ